MKLSRINLKGIERVLVVKPSAFGDIIHTLPAVQAIARAFPQCAIGWAVRGDLAPFLDLVPAVKRVFAFERRLGAPWRIAGFVRQIRAFKPSAAIDFQGLLRSGLITYASGAPARVGFAGGREMSPLFYTHRVETDSVHAIDRNRAVAAACGADVASVDYGLCIDGALKEKAAASLLGDSRAPLLLLNPFSKWPSKNLTEDAAWRIIALAAERGYAVVLTGTEADAPFAARLERRFGSGAFVDATGRTDLKELAALISLARVVVSVDSAVMHLGCALGITTIGLFGPTDPARTGPYGPRASVLRVDAPCAPCRGRRCRLGRDCLAQLDISRLGALLPPA